eukprot:PhM_4_TR17442/c0_g1_i3/m.88658
MRVLQALHGGPVLRMICTGRHFGLIEKLREDVSSWPLDYIAVSSGAQIYRWGQSQPEHVLTLSLTSEQAQRLARTMDSLDCNCMVHTEDHGAVYTLNKTFGKNSDFMTRVQNTPHGELVDTLFATDAAAAESKWVQIVIVLAAHNGDPSPERVLSKLNEAFPDKELTFLQCTSTTDPRCQWVEVLAGSKQRACAIMCESHGIDRERTWAIGNDFNDLDMLKWAAVAYVAPGAPAELGAMFPTSQGAKGDSNGDNDVPPVLHCFEKQFANH